MGNSTVTSPGETDTACHGCLYDAGSERFSAAAFYEKRNEIAGELEDESTLRHLERFLTAFEELILDFKQTQKERCEEIMMKQKVYYGKDIEVMFNSEVCIHSGICVKGLPGVFDLSKRPWVDPDADTTEAIARHIDTCPSGALTYRRLDVEYSTEKEG